MCSICYIQKSLQTFFMLALLVEFILLTTFYGLYFNHQLHITSYNFFKSLPILQYKGVTKKLYQDTDTPNSNIDHSWGQKRCPLEEGQH